MYMYMPLAWYTLLLVTLGTGGGIVAFHKSQTEREVSLDSVVYTTFAWLPCWTEAVHCRIGTKT